MTDFFRPAPGFVDACQDEELGLGGDQRADCRAPPIPRSEARLAKLEQRNAEFVVTWPEYLDRDGNKVSWCFDIDEHAVDA